MSKTVLVVEGNTVATCAVMESLGGTPYGPAYASLIESLAPGTRTHVVRPAEDGPDCLPEGTRLSDYDGIVWTGSALNGYDDTPEVTSQIWLAKAAYASGTPNFGSCWGLQVFTKALGGSVRRNPKGRELGIGQDITLTNEGLSHPMYRDKDGRFDALEVHMDEVEKLPEGAIVLASNAMSAVQAMSIEQGENSFWGVQYHPEFDFATMAVVMQRLRDVVLGEELFLRSEEVDEVISNYLQWHDDDATAQASGLSASVIDGHLRRLEIANWLFTKVYERR